MARVRLSAQPVCLVILAGIAVGAEPLRADDTADDLRFVYSRGPDRYAISSAAPNLDHAGHWDRAHGIRLDLVRSHQPLGVGLSVAGQQNSEDHGGDRLGYQALSGRLNLGVALAPADQVQFEVLPFAGYGLSEFEHVGAASGGLRRDRDDFFEYGLNVNATLTTASGLQFGGGVGYLVNESSYSLPGSSAGTVTIEQQGPVYSVFIGTRH